MNATNEAARVLVELDQLIAEAEDQQDCCSESGPNEAMKRALALKDIRAAVAELMEAAEAELVEVERRERLGAIRPEERGTANRLRAALIRCSGEHA